MGSADEGLAAQCIAKKEGHPGIAKRHRDTDPEGLRLVRGAEAAIEPGQARGEAVPVGVGPAGAFERPGPFLPIARIGCDIALDLIARIGEAQE